MGSIARMDPKPLSNCRYLSRAQAIIPKPELRIVFSKLKGMAPLKLRKAYSKIYSHPDIAVYTHIYSFNPHVHLLAHLAE